MALVLVVMVEPVTMVLMVVVMAELVGCALLLLTLVVSLMMRDAQQELLLARYDSKKSKLWTNQCDISFIP